MTVKQAAAGLSRLVSAYDIARTMFDPKQRIQRVLPEIVFPVSVVVSDVDAAAARSELFSTMVPSPFSVEDEPPIRFGLAVSCDVVTRLSA